MNSALIPFREKRDSITNDGRCLDGAASGVRLHQILVGDTQGQVAHKDIESRVVFLVLGRHFDEKLIGCVGFRTISAINEQALDTSELFDFHKFIFRLFGIYFHHLHSSQVCSQIESAFFQFNTNVFWKTI